jgi:excisionase family DNA binding protein
MSGFNLTLPSEALDALAELVAEKVRDGQPAPQLPDDGRLAYRPNEAAEAIGVSSDHFERHVIPDLRVIRSGRLRLIPRAELERWLAESAAMLGER